MKMRRTLICALVLSIIATFFVLSCVRCNAAADPDISSVDFNNDSVINMNDIVIIAAAFNSCRGDSGYIEKLDLNGDGAVNLIDVIIVAKYFNRKVPTPLPTQIPTPTDKFSQETDFDFDATTGTITKYKGSGGHVRIPDMINGVRVTSIGEDAFYGCSNVTGVTIPDGVTRIGVCAFYNCKIGNVTIPASVTSIGAGAFAMSQLFNVTFLGNQPLFEIEYIGSFDWLTGPFGAEAEDFKITVSPTATGFGKPEPYNNETTWEWAQLDNIKYTVCVYDTSLVDIGDCVFSARTGKIVKYKGKGGNVIIPGEINGAIVTGIGERAFEGCSEVTSITIPQGVTSIYHHAFADCKGLKSVTMPKALTCIEKYVFYGCSNLAGITIPDGVTDIGAYTFYGCSAMTSITIPDRVTSIGVYAFYGCSAMTGISIPESITSIGDLAFFGCSALTSISIPESITSIGVSAFYSCGALTSISMPESMNCSIGDYAFSYCSALTSITIPKGVTSIGTFAFVRCSALTSITIPESVTSIGGGAFYGCGELNYALFLGNQAPHISGTNVFYLTKKEFKVFVLPTATGFSKPSFMNGASWKWCGVDTYEVVISDINYNFDAATGTILKYKGPGGDVTIPNEINGTRVTCIGEYAFSYINGLNSVTIPVGVTSIGKGAFCDCKALTSITIPESVTSIGESAFRDCSELSCTVFLGNQPTFGANVLSGVKEDFKIIVSPTAAGFGKPEPYNNELSWNWNLDNCGTYKVEIRELWDDIDYELEGLLEI